MDTNIVIFCKILRYTFDSENNKKLTTKKLSKNCEGFTQNFRVYSRKKKLKHPPVPAPISISRACAPDVDQRDRFCCVSSIFQRGTLWKSTWRFLETRPERNL